MKSTLFFIILFLQIAREHSIPFLETSAKASINVEKAFMDLVNAILVKTPDLEPKGIDITHSETKKTGCF